ncbi:DNA-binding transcriptional regulator, MarR family [Saccharopolyspora kobensis]|uniref:DNA-binding transcriptional regulator, MarR family n=1 Tax=Saccharopolyspora kobensis TaxID=146035 RepID=A0A1H6CW11_9PSEU|nr:MarR family transcriptional regulator [Saccharopolyspora kobensis]SEG76997.1 DNA-binding transcriptional regulator, MarR family [Saccharopolyspora kobensis]SFD00954.1 DNA-binding transcriptional regulator, MarR family [Saccharopolyspora kobensis]
MDDFPSALMALHRELRGIYAATARRFGLTAQQVELLCLLGDRAPSLGELAAMLGCDKTNVTGMVDRLERRELLSRAADRNDRRVARLSLTAEGAALGGQIRAAFSEAVAERWGSLDAADVGAIARLASRS